jgi:cyclic pyranopterin phosphate synthase
MDLRKHLREGTSKAYLASLIRSAWERRRDRGAEQRLLLKDRQPLVQIGELKAKPHLEMHTRGG